MIGNEQASVTIESRPAIDSSTLSAFQELGQALRWRAEELILALRVYFDDSGESRPRAIGGCIATFGAWTQFEQEWRDLLRDFGLTWFRTSDFENCRGAFLLWAGDEERRQEFRERMTSVLRPHMTTLIGCVVPKYALKPREKEEKPQKGEKEQAWAREHRRMARSPYCISLAWCLRIAIEKVVRPLKETLEIVLADQDKEIGSSALLYEAIKRWPAFAPYVAGLSLGQNPRLTLPLQAADLVAYEVLKAHSERGRWTFNRLKTMRHYFGTAERIFQGWLL